MLNATISLRLVRVRGPSVWCFVIQVPLIKARGPHLGILPNQTSTIEFNMARLILEHKHQMTHVAMRMERVLIL